MTNSLFVLLIVIWCFWFGWFLRDMWEWLRRIQSKVASLKATPPPPAEAPPVSMWVEPREETPQERAQREQDELIERLNEQSRMP